MKIPKKTKQIICQIFLFFTIVLSSNYVTRANQPITVMFNGQALDFDVPPTIIDGRTMVPLRVIFEAHGANVSWDGINGTVTATMGDLIVTAGIGNVFINVNGVNTEMDVAPVIIDGRTLVPARFVSEALGSDVTWDGNTRTVFITSILGDEWENWFLIDWDWIEWDLYSDGTIENKNN
jgi:hypothetical protein